MADKTPLDVLIKLRDFQDAVQLSISDQASEIRVRKIIGGAAARAPKETIQKLGQLIVDIRFAELQEEAAAN